MNTKGARKIWWLFGGFAVLVLLLAAVIILFVSARLQQGLLTKAPSYEPDTLYSRGVEQFSKGDYAAAEASLEQALKAQDAATYRSQLAVVKYRLQKYQESVTLYQRLIDEGSDAAFAWNGMGNAYRDWAAAEAARRDELNAKALAAYEQSYTLNPQYLAAYSNAALLYANLGEEEKAVAVLNRGIAATGSTELSQVRSRVLQK